MSDTSKAKSIGAIWKRKQKSDGKTYLSGQIELNGQTVKFVAFTNSFKEEDKHPDFKLYIANGGTQDSAKPSAAKVSAPKAAPKSVARPITAPVDAPETESATDDGGDLF